MIPADPASFDTPAQRQQYAALCWRRRKGQVLVLLITSRDTGRWLIPKGQPMKHRAPHDAAQLEAWEEAGVRGTALPTPLGSYRLARADGPPPGPSVVVTVFPLAVTGLDKTWPEAGERRRKWVAQDRAAAMVAEPDLAALIAGFAPPSAGVRSAS